MKPWLDLRRRSLWDLAILVLGLHIWVSLLLIPALHLGRLPRAVPVLAALALAVLLIGALTRTHWILLAAYPVALLLPSIADPRLVGVNVLSTRTFIVVALGFVAYTLGTALLLQLLATAEAPDGRRRLQPVEHEARWRRRRRIYRTVAAFAAVFPSMLIYALFLDETVRADLARFYPRRAAAASALFGVFAVGLWLFLFRAYVLRPLHDHLRGDPGLQADLLRLRRGLRRRSPRRRFYLWVTLALASTMVVLLRG